MIIQIASKDAVVEVNEFKKSLIVWAQNQSTGYRTDAAISNKKYGKERLSAKADSFDFMVKYLQGMEIKE